ncbi:hypothetical protein AB0D56_19745 [Streptomyces sp. NPDC048209]|uniref:hypothetical protein n=1 Tax=Streptomyces sp. NPDC048209 TaxID=3156689 RepID=UPI0034320C27
MKLSVPVLRRHVVGALIGTALLASAPVASAASALDATPRRTQAAPAGGASPGPLALYRGVQGGNLCLLARCTVGDSGGSPGPSNTQGFNLCLLALCTVRP